MTYNSSSLPLCTRVQNGSLSKPRRGVERDVLHWTRYPIGVLAKLELYLWANQNYATDQDLANHTLGQLGILEEYCLQAIEERVPLFPQFYLYKTGNFLTPHICSERLHKFYYCAGKGVQSKVKGGTANFRLSEEHPKVNSVMIECLAAVVARKRATGASRKSYCGWDMVELEQILRKHGRLPKLYSTEWPEFLAGATPV